MIGWIPWIFGEIRGSQPKYIFVHIFLRVVYQVFCLKNTCDRIVIILIIFHFLENVEIALCSPK